ncbi:hypothetical protein ACN08M_17645 [Photobacterium leiognathi subsp. mandapamensis]
MSLVRVEDEAKVALRWYRKTMTVVSKTKLRTRLVSIFIIFAIFMLPKLYAVFLTQSIVEHNKPHYESSKVFYKKIGYLYLIDLLNACIETQPKDKLKGHYCAKAEEHYKNKIDRKSMADVDQTIELKAYSIMKSDAKYMLHRLDLKEIQNQHPKKIMPSFDFIFVWWFEILTLIIAVVVGSIFYLSAYSFNKEI